MTAEELDWLFVKNEEHYKTIQVHYLKCLGASTIEEFERLYEDYIDPKFNLHRTCPDCVYDMVYHVYQYAKPLWQQYQQQNILNQITITTDNGSSKQCEEGATRNDSQEAEANSGQGSSKKQHPKRNRR